MAYLYAYSLREKTHAAHKLRDDVRPEDKSRRLAELITAWRTEVGARNARDEMGRVHLVLVEGPARKAVAAGQAAASLTGRTDTNKRLVFSASREYALVAGDYAAVRVTDVTGHTLRGEALHRSSIAEWAAATGGAPSLLKR